MASLITMIYSNSSVVSNLMWGFMLLANCTFFLLFQPEI